MKSELSYTINYDVDSVFLRTDDMYIQLKNLKEHGVNNGTLRGCQLPAPGLLHPSKDKIKAEPRLPSHLRRGSLFFLTLPPTAPPQFSFLLSFFIFNISHNGGSSEMRYILSSYFCPRQCQFCGRLANLPRHMLQCLVI